MDVQKGMERAEVRKNGREYREDVVRRGLGPGLTIVWGPLLCRD